GINAALQAGNSYIPAGDYLLSGSIVIPSNRTLYIDGGANITLDDDADAYIMRNDDFTGDQNISIIGVNGRPNIDGNGYNQTRDYSTTVMGTASYWGIGLNFEKIQNLLVESIKVIESSAWGIGHFYGD